MDGKARATIQANFNSSAGTVKMMLFDNNLNQIATSSPDAGGASIQYFGTTGAAYFLEVTGSNPKVTFSVNGAPTPNVASPAATPASTPVSSGASNAASTTSLFASSSTTPAATQTSPSATDLVWTDDSDWLTDSDD